MTPDLRKIAAALGGDVAGNSAMVPTPGHSPRDRGTSISLSETAPDGVVVNCFNGDARDALAVKDVLRDKGLIRKLDAASEDRSGRNEQRPKRLGRVGSWEFIGRDGEVLYRKVRIARSDGGKDFIYEHPDGRGGWAHGRGNAGPVPYRLPDLLQADRGAVVYTAEGEKKADRLAEWGLVATSHKDFPKGTIDGSPLKGRTVVILPDNDDAGERYARRMADIVRGSGGRPVMVRLPGLFVGGDILDWTGTRETLLELADTAIASPDQRDPFADVVRPDPASRADAGDEVELLPVIDAGDLEGVPVTPREWGLDGWEPWRSCVYLTGLGATGKSLLTQQRMTCAAAGLNFFGVQLRPGIAIYITCEDDMKELHRRQETINAALGITWADLRGRLFLVSLKGQLNKELATFDVEGRMRVSPRWLSLRRTIEQVGATHVALDNVAHFYTGNENIRNQVAAFVGLLDGLAEEIDGVVLLLGHPNKAGAEFSGSTAWENQVRSRLFLSLDKVDGGEVVDPDARVLTNSKPNYSRRGQELRFRWHEWAFVVEAELGTDERAGLAATAQAASDNLIFLECLDLRNRQRRAVSEKRSPTFAPTEFAKMAESRRIGKARLEAAMDRLFRTGEIERGELWKGDDRKPVFGLRRTPEKGAGNGAVNTMRETRVTVSNGAESRAGNAAETHTHIYMGGRGPEDRAPASWESDDPAADAYLDGGSR